MKENEAAAATTRWQLLAVRGGSIGFPATSNSNGLLAGVSLRAAGGDGISAKTSADAFSKIGGVKIANISAEAIGESFEADVPQASLLDASPQAKMASTGFASVGLRFRWNRFATVWAKKVTPAPCVGILAQRVAASPELDRESKMNAINKTVEATPNWGSTECTKDDLAALTQKTSVSVTGGLRLVQRGAPDTSLTDPTGFQWELAVRRDSEAQVSTRRSWSIMGGVSGMHLNRSDVAASEGMPTTRYLEMNELRASFATEVRSPATEDSTTTSAAGVYGVLSRNSWTNRYAVGDSRKVRDYQFEGGLYMSGAMSGFSGSIMVSVIRPYTGGQYIYALTVAPFGGGVAASGAAE